MAHPSAPQFSSSPSGDLRVPLAETAGRNGDPHADGKGPLRVSLMTRPNCAVNASHIAGYRQCSSGAFQSAQPSATFSSYAKS